jgi:hypothetical protein
MTIVDPETELNTLLAAHARPQPWELRHPFVALRAARLLRRLPVHTYTPSGSPDSRLIEDHLDKSHAGLRTPLHQAATVLQLPERPGTYAEGPHMATQRQQARKPLRAGVTWTHVADRAEQDRLLDLAHRKTEAERRDGRHPDEVDLPSLLQSPHWLAAWQDDRPILLAVTAVDAPWAMLRYFCRLEDDRIASATRYLMTGVLAEDLIDRGVRYLCTNTSPLRMPPGVREFSRMVGFRTLRVRVVR